MGYHQVNCRQAPTKARAEQGRQGQVQARKMQAGRQAGTGREGRAGKGRAGSTTSPPTPLHLGNCNNNVCRQKHWAGRHGHAPACNGAEHRQKGAGRCRQCRQGARGQAAGPLWQNLGGAAGMAGRQALGTPPGRQGRQQAAATV